MVEGSVQCVSEQKKKTRSSRVGTTNPHGPLKSIEFDLLCKAGLKLPRYVFCTENATFSLKSFLAASRIQWVCKGELAPKTRRFARIVRVSSMFGVIYRTGKGSESDTKLRGSAMCGGVVCRAEDGSDFVCA